MSAFFTSILMLFLTSPAAAPKAPARQVKAVKAAVEQFELSEDDFQTANPAVNTAALSRPAHW